VSRLLIAAPLRLEAAMIASGRPPGRVHRVGMGAQRARAAVPTLREDPAAALLVMGLGGGLASESRVGEVIVADAVGEDGAEPIPCHGVEELARALAGAGLPVRRGPVVSVSKIAVGETRTRLGAAGALAVDMESAWLAAAARGRPFAVVRVLSDTPTQELLRPRGLLGIARACATLRHMARALHDWTPGE
jgi:4-hydroxy-3-methylbut-2-enyl diphosphate reductase